MSPLSVKHNNHHNSFGHSGDEDDGISKVGRRPHHPPEDQPPVYTHHLEDANSRNGEEEEEEHQLAGRHSPPPTTMMFHDQQQPGSQQDREQQQQQHSHEPTQETNTVPAEPTTQHPSTVTTGHTQHQRTSRMIETDYTSRNVELPDYDVNNDLDEAFVPSDQDVICGWARQNYNHGGNKKLRNLIDSNVMVYMNASTKSEKGQVIVNIVEQIRRESPTGVGMVKLNPTTGRWAYIGTNKAKDKIGHGTFIFLMFRYLDISLGIYV